ncbi:hypothetical protein C8F01DRAFT_1271115 [Mycena amicta]|nr:hypothetical protein C8F01DRAFT_1271115 [Mycena amicta]
MEALSPASCLCQALLYTKAGYDKLLQMNEAARCVNYGAQLICLGRKVEAAVLQGDPTAGEAVDGLSDKEEDELAGDKEQEEEEEDESDGARSKEQKTTTTARKKAERREHSIRVRVDFVYAYLEDPETCTKAETLAKWVCRGWAKKASGGDVEDTALAEAGVGFASPDDETSWYVLLDGHTARGADDYLKMMKRSLRLDVVEDHIKRDVQLLAILAVIGQEAYVQGVIIKIETLKCQQEYNSHQGQGAHRKWQHNLGVFANQQPALFEGMLIDEREESVAKGGPNHERFTDWLKTREKLVSARNRLLNTYTMLGTAMLLHPYFTTENLISPSNRYAKVLEGIIEKDKQNTASAVGSTFAEHEEDCRMVLFELLDACVLQAAEQLVRVLLFFRVLCGTIVHQFVRRLAEPVTDSLSCHDPKELSPEDNSDEEEELITSNNPFDFRLLSRARVYHVFASRLRC